MFNALRHGWVPLGSFILAVALSGLSGPSSRALGLRPRAATTGPCKHVKVITPQNPTGEVCLIDGILSFKALNKHSFDPTHHELFDTRMKCIAKARDASLCLKARAEWATGGEIASDSTQAYVQHVYSEGDPATCCHSAELQATGVLSGRVRTHGAFGVGDLATAEVGVAPAPMYGLCRVEYDNNCNGIPEGRLEKASVVATLKSDRPAKSLPTHSVATGFLRVDVTDFTETEAVELPPRIEPINVDETHAGGVAVKFNSGTVGPNLTKNFKLRSYSFITTEGIAAAFVSGVGKKLPLASADAAFDVSRLRAVDVTEASIAELTK